MQDHAPLPEIPILPPDAPSPAFSTHTLHMILAEARCFLWHTFVALHPGASGEKSSDYVWQWKQGVLNYAAIPQILPLGLEPGEPFIQAWSKRRDPEDSERADARFLSAIASGASSYTAEFRCLDQNGALRWQQEDVHLSIRELGRLWEVVGVITDITTLREAEEALHASHERYRQAVDHAGAVLYQRERDASHYSFVSARIFDLTGYTPEEFSVEIWDEIVLETDLLGEAAASGLTLLQARVEEREGRLPELQTDHRIRTKTGEERWINDSYVSLRDDVGHVTGWLGILQDVTDRKQAEERAWREAYHDQLTALPNRTLFENRLAQALAAATRHGDKVAVLFLDLDRFKVVNDTLGHSAGDRLLKVASSRIASILRAEDTLARRGGDEFTVLLPRLPSHSPREAVRRVARKILEALEAPFTLDEQPFYLSASIGISLFPEDGQDVETLLKHADIAMYQAKAAGGGQYQEFAGAMTRAARQKLRLETELRRALERSDFCVHCQPLVNFATNRIVSVEALARCQRAKGQLIPPAQFIPLAEETGLIIPIGEMIITRACQQAAEWQRAGFNIRLAVNISARQITLPSFADTLREILVQTGLPPDYLDIELTESALLIGGEMLEATLAALKQLGIRLILDDFGTGYSSLSHLRRYAFDALKIDRSFVQNLPDSTTDAALVRGIIELAHGLGLEAVAEGIETEAQRDKLAAMNCDVLQGYLLSPPRPAAELEPLLQANFARASPEDQPMPIQPLSRNEE